MNKHLAFLRILGRIGALLSLIALIGSLTELLRVNLLNKECDVT